MATSVFQNGTCPYCGSEAVYEERNCCTQEFLSHCMACGSFESFDFRYNKNGLIQKTVSIPMDEIALTVRIFDPKIGLKPIVWRSFLPMDADTDFLYHYLNERQTVLKKSHPGFTFPDLEILAEKYGNQPICCIERRSANSLGGDGQSYIQLNRPGNSFEIRTVGGVPVFLLKRARYKYRRSVGKGVICIEYTNGAPIYWRTFSPGTTVERAKRLWTAHANKNMDMAKSYMTLMADGKLQLLKGSGLLESS